MDELFPHSSSEDESSSLCNYNTIKYVIQNISSGKMIWELHDNEAKEDKIDYIIDQLLVSVDYSLIDDFLISHRLFINTVELIDKLLLKFAQILDEMGDASEEQYGKVRMFAIIQRWLQSPYTTFDLDSQRDYLRIRLETVKETTKSKVDIKLIDSLINKIDSGKSTETSEYTDNSDTMSIQSNSSTGHRWKNLFSRSRTSTGDSNASHSFFDSMTSLDSMLSVYSGAHFLLANSTEALAESLFVIESRVLLAIDWKELIEFPLKTSSPQLSVKAAVDHFNTVPY